MRGQNICGTVNNLRHFCPFPKYSSRKALRKSRKSYLQPAAAVYTGLKTPEEDIHPAYKKYQTIYELNTSELRKIERDEAHNVELPDPTALSLLQYVLGCIKFMLIPRPVRYVWYRIWTWLRSTYYPYHRRLVLEGSKLDYYLQQKAERTPKIDRNLALRRFHWRVSPWENAIYRSFLVKDILQSHISKGIAGARQKLQHQQPF